jgi:hypothetical protein
LRDGDDFEVFGIEQFSWTILQPLGARQRLAHGTAPGVGSGRLFLTGKPEPFPICVLDRIGIDAARLRDHGHPVWNTCGNIMGKAAV